MLSSRFCDLGLEDSLGMELEGVKCAAEVAVRLYHFQQVFVQL